MKNIIIYQYFYNKVKNKSPTLMLIKSKSDLNLKDVLQIHGK